jgi:hypothetical protein
MCVKCKIFLGGGGNNPSTPLAGLVIFTWATAFQSGPSSLKISVAQLAIMHKKLIWDPAYVPKKYSNKNDSWEDIY